MSDTQFTMKDIPTSTIDKEHIKKQIQELMSLKEQVTVKRRQLNALGVKNDPELNAMLIKYPDLQPKYIAKKAAKQEAAKQEAAKQEAPKQIVPADSPFIDPNQKQQPIAKAVEEPKQDPVTTKPAPTPVEPTKPVDIPKPKPTTAQTLTIAGRPSNIKAGPIRVGIDGKWF